MRQAPPGRAIAAGAAEAGAAGAAGTWSQKGTSAAGGAGAAAAGAAGWPAAGTCSQKGTSAAGAACAETRARDSAKSALSARDTALQQRGAERWSSSSLTDAGAAGATASKAPERLVGAGDAGAAAAAAAAGAAAGAGDGDGEASVAVARSSTLSGVTAAGWQRREGHASGSEPLGLPGRELRAQAERPQPGRGHAPWQRSERARRQRLGSALRRRAPRGTSWRGRPPPRRT